MDLFRRRNYAPLSLVAIRAVSSPCAALRQAARLSRDCSSSRRENAETFASLLVPTELSRSSLIFTPRGYKRTRAPHRRYSDCYTKCQSRHSSARAGFSVSTIRRSIMLVRDSNFFQEAESESRILGGVKPVRTRGRKARMGLHAKCMHFVGSPGWRGNSNSPRDEKPIRSVLGYDEKIERVSLSTTNPLHPQERVSYSHVKGR